jgi:hypothetical protein
MHRFEEGIETFCSTVYTYIHTGINYVLVDEIFILHEDSMTESVDRCVMYKWTVSYVLCGEKMCVNHIAQRNWVILWFVQV